jgi:hypothetical protein
VRSEGIIAVHITNTYFDFRPVLQRVAEHFKLHYAMLHTDGDGTITSYSDWVLLSRDPTIIDSLPGALTDSRKPDFALWTDEYSNLFSVLRR